MLSEKERETLAERIRIAIGVLHLAAEHRFRRRDHAARGQHGDLVAAVPQHREATSITAESLAYGLDIRQVLRRMEAQHLFLSGRRGRQRL